MTWKRSSRKPTAPVAASRRAVAAAIRAIAKTVAAKLNKGPHRSRGAALCTFAASRYDAIMWRFPRRQRRAAMAKGQMRKSKEARKPKKEKPKTIAANPSSKGK